MPRRLSTGSHADRFLFALSACVQIASDIVNNVMKKLVGLSVEGAKVLDICVEGDKLIEQGTGAVYNKSVKGVKVSKGASDSAFCVRRSGEVLMFVRVLVLGAPSSVRVKRHPSTACATFFWRCPCLLTPSPFPPSLSSDLTHLPTL